MSDTAVHYNKCHTDPPVTQGNSVVSAVSKLANTISTFAGNRKNNANMTDLNTLARTVQSRTEQNKHHASLPAYVTRLPEESDINVAACQATPPQAVRAPRVTKATESPSETAD